MYSSSPQKTMKNSKSVASISQNLITLDLNKYQLLIARRNKLKQETKRNSSLSSSRSATPVKKIERKLTLSPMMTKKQRTLVLSLEVNL